MATVLIMAIIMAIHSTVCRLARALLTLPGRAVARPCVEAAAAAAAAPSLSAAELARLFGMPYDGLSAGAGPAAALTSACSAANRAMLARFHRCAQDFDRDVVARTVLDAVLAHPRDPATLRDIERLCDMVVSPHVGAMLSSVSLYLRLDAQGMLRALLDAWPEYAIACVGQRVELCYLMRLHALGEPAGNSWWVAPVDERSIWDARIRQGPDYRKLDVVIPTSRGSRTPHLKGTTDAAITMGDIMSVPNLLRDVLGRRGEGMIVLAGGSVKKALTALPAKRSDLDLWFVGYLSVASAQQALDSALAAVAANSPRDFEWVGSKYLNNSAITFKCEGQKVPDIQFILRYGYKSIAHVLLGFDFPTVQCAWDGTTFYASAACMLSLAHRVTVPDATLATAASRAVKQAKDGFQVVLPREPRLHAAREALRRMTDAQLRQLSDLCADSCLAMLMKAGEPEVQDEASRFYDEEETEEERRARFAARRAARRRSPVSIGPLRGLTAPMEWWEGGEPTRRRADPLPYLFIPRVAADEDDEEE